MFASPHHTARSRPGSRSWSRPSTAGSMRSKSRPLSRERRAKLEALAARESSGGRQRVATVLKEKLLGKVAGGARGCSAGARAVVEGEVDRFLSKHPRITKRALVLLERRVLESVSRLDPEENGQGEGEGDGSGGGNDAGSPGAEHDGAGGGAGGMGTTAGTTLSEFTSTGNTAIESLPLTSAETKGKEWLMLDTYWFIQGKDKDQREKEARRQAALDLNDYLMQQVQIKKEQREKEREEERIYAEGRLNDVDQYQEEELTASRRRKQLMVAQKDAQEEQVRELKYREEQERLDHEYDDSLQVQWCKDAIEKEKQQRLVEHKQVRKEAAQTRLDNESLRMRKIEMKQEEREDDLRLMKLYTEIEEARIKRRDDEMAERARQQAARQRGYEKNEGAEQAARDKAETDRLMAQQAEKDRIALERIRRDKRNAIERQRDVNKVLLEQIRYKKAKAEEERLSQTEFTAKCRKDAAEYMRDLEQARTADREKKLQQRELLEAQVRARNSQILDQMNMRELKLNSQELGRIVSNKDVYDRVLTHEMFASSTSQLNKSKRPASAGVSRSSRKQGASFSPIAGNYNAFKKSSRPGSASLARGSSLSRSAATLESSRPDSRQKPRKLEQILTARSYSADQL